MEEDVLISIHNAYTSGKMSPEDAAEYEADVKAGTMQLPQGGSLITTREQVETPTTGAVEEVTQIETAPEIKAGPTQVPMEVFDAYFDGTLPSAERLELARDVAEGTVLAPEGITTEKTVGSLPNQVVDRLVKDRSFGEKVSGAKEAALALGTGATTGTVGQIVGTLKGLINSIASGKFGTDEGAELVEKTANELAQMLTYEPTTQAGKEYTEAIGETLAPLEAFAPLGAEIGTATRAKALPKVAPEAESVGELVRKAAKEKPTATKAKKKLAEAADIDVEAQKAAEVLDIDLPADVYSESQMVKEAAGLTRSVAGSEVSGAWKESIIKASDKADEAMRKMDASTDIATVSSDVKASLNNVRDSLQSQAKDIYTKVDEVVPKTSKVSVNTLHKTLNDIVDEVGEQGLSAQEAKLLNMINNEDVTYGRLIREKSLIGKAIENKDSPYGNMDAGSLKRLYGALKEDQLSSVEKIGGEELRGNLRLANQITAKQKALEKRIVSSFGKENEGSIAALMRRSITQGTKGDITALDKLLKSVPKELQKETIATALMASTRAKGGIAKDGFGFSEFAKTYKGLRDNAPIYNKIVNVLGEGSNDLLTSLYKVSKRVTDARANVLTTGKANQAILNAMTAENLTSKIMNSTAGRSAATGAAAVTGGAPGAMMASGLMSMLQKGRKNPIEAAGKMFKSDEFNKLVTEASTGKVDNKTVKALTNSSAFRKWNKTIGNVIKSPEAWILESLVIPQEEKER